MSITVPYTVILQSVSTGSVSTMLMEASPNTPAAQARANTVAPQGTHVVALVKGNHPVIPGVPSRM
jgi:hypothetical protein